MCTIDCARQMMMGRYTAQGSKIEACCHHGNAYVECGDVVLDGNCSHQIIVLRCFFIAAALQL